MLGLRTLTALLVTGSLALGCGGGSDDTYILVTVAAGNVTAPVRTLEVQLTLAGATASRTLSEPGDAPIVLPTTAVFRVRSGLVDGAAVQ